MKVLVVGANGQIGQFLVNLLKESKEHTVRAMVRTEEQVAAFKKIGVETALADLEGSVADITEAARGCDAVVFTAGSGGHTGTDKTLLIDLDGAAKSIEAAENAGANRFIMVSAMQAHNRDNWHESMRPYYVAKHYADKVLVASDLTYTVIRPGLLVNEPSTGKITVAENISGGAITREDVAKTIFASLTNTDTFHRSFDLVNGEDTFDDALALNNK